VEDVFAYELDRTTDSSRAALETKEERGSGSVR
jgi:hypothetical protein